MSQPATSTQQLQDAFELFNRVSEQLTGSYQALQQQVLDLSRQLDDSRDERLRLLRDIRTLQDEASRTQRLSSMGEMTARLAHQIRTPLATALLYASQLEQDNLAPEQRRCFVQRLLVGLRHLDHMVNDMLLFARGGKAGEEDIVLSELLEDVRQSLLPRLEATGASWSVQLLHPDAAVRGQRDVLASALCNLANNSLDACGEAGRLEWQVGRDGDLVCLSLQDDGPGIDPDEAQRIFEPFHTTRSNGTGLGLTVVRAVVDAHGGCVELDSSRRTGARFVIRLPALQIQRLPSDLSQRPHDNKAIANSRYV